MSIFVLDNSVTMRWFFEAGEHPYADKVLADLSAEGSEAVVPVLWRYEVSSVLARAEIKQMAVAQDVADFLADLSLLPIHIDSESDLRILTDVHRLAVTYRLTTYDAAYLELALRRSLPLATLDADLIAASERAGIQIA